MLVNSENNDDWNFKTLKIDEDVSFSIIKLAKQNHSSINRLFHFHE